MSDDEREMSHAESWDLLPWLANGTLEPREAERVRRHLEQCGRCREELSRCAVLRDGVRGIESLGPDPHPVQLERLWRRIEESETREEPRAASRWRRSATGGARRSVSSGLYAAAAALAIAAGLAWFGSGGHVPAFRTLSAPSAPLRADEIRIVFSDTATEAELRELLRGVGVEIVAGPSPTGVYTVRVVTGGNGDAIAQAVDELRKRPQVRFAEPVSPRGR